MLSDFRGDGAGGFWLKNLSIIQITPSETPG
jgi:hypothetical protein